MILRIDSISLQRGISWSCLLFLLAASIQWTGATAQAQAVDARVASVKGTALRRNNQRSFILARGDSLNPGDEIDTRGGGRVVIELTDGSVVVIHPNSRIVMSNYRAAASMREMFRILIGRVRVKVAHFGGKPNPYRVNSPTASILVRGTEFSVAVEPSGDTRVEVYDGLVEVQSLSEPSRRVLLSKGQGALVKPNEDIRFFTPGSGDRTDERGGKNDGGDGADDGANDANADTNDGDDGASAATKANDGVNAKTKADDGVNAKTKANAGADAPTDANAGVIALTNTNAGVIIPTDANGGVIIPTDANGGVIIPTDANGGVIVPTNGKGSVSAPTNDNGGVSAPTNGNGGVSAPTNGNGGVNAPTNDNGGVSAPKNGNGGVNAPPKANGGANAKTNGNGGASATTKANGGVNAPPKANGANAKTNASAGLNAKTNGNGGASAPTNGNGGASAPTNDNASVNAPTDANGGVDAKTNAKGGVIAPTDANGGGNAKTNANAGGNAKTNNNVNTPTNDNAGLNTPTKANDGANAATKANAGVKAKTKANDGASAATNASAGLNDKTNASAGRNDKTNEKVGLYTTTNDNDGLNRTTNDNVSLNTATKANDGANSPTNANAVVSGVNNANTSPNVNVGARANINANAKRNDVGGVAGAAGKSAAHRPEDRRMGGEKETFVEGAAKSAARPSGDNNPARDEVAANATTSVKTFLTKDYERYVDNLAVRGWAIPLQRFSAFADSHFDSLDNPAYSTEFASIEGRAWLIPFFSKSRGGALQSGSAGFPFSSDLISPFDSGVLAQADFFIPLEKVRMVIGGAVAISRDRSQSLTVDQAPASLIRLLPGGGQVSRLVAVSTDTTSITGSLMVARRFGDDGRTSVGAGVEWVSGGGDLRGQISLANASRALAVEKLESDSQINRLRFRLGMTRKFDGGHKLGLVYSYELATADDRDRLRFFAGGPLSLDSARQEGRSSEVSFKLRGPLTRRLFYGLEGSLLWGESDERIRRSVITDSTTRADVNSASVGFGVGFALRRATVLSADFAFGFSGVGEERLEDATGNSVEYRQERGRFVSGRMGLQTDVWRSLFFSASTLVFGQAATTDLDLRPDLFGRRLTSLGLVELSGRSRRNSTSVFSDFGSGWRFNRNIIAEYIFSINNGLGPTRHVFLLRYTFKREK
jgi:FecR protein